MSVGGWRRDKQDPPCEHCGGNLRWISLGMTRETHSNGKFSFEQPMKL
jgi:hypothetical protein